MIQLSTHQAETLAALLDKQGSTISARYVRQEQQVLPEHYDSTLTHLEAVSLIERRGMDLEEVRQKIENDR